MYWSLRHLVWVDVLEEFGQSVSDFELAGVVFIGGVQIADESCEHANVGRNYKLM